MCTFRIAAEGGINITNSQLKTIITAPWQCQDTRKRQLTYTHDHQNMKVDVFSNPSPPPPKKINDYWFYRYTKFFFPSRLPNNFHKWPIKFWNVPLSLMHKGPFDTLKFKLSQSLLPWVQCNNSVKYYSNPCFQWKLMTRTMFKPLWA